jgi:hypothetical protein
LRAAEHTGIARAFALVAEDLRAGVRRVVEESGDEGGA